MLLCLRCYKFDLYEAAYNMVAGFSKVSKSESASKREVTNFYNLILEELSHQFSPVFC